MAAALRNSVLYDNLFVKKYLGDARDRGGRIVPLPFELVVLSPSTNGDTYNLQVIPANAKVVGLECNTDGLGGSVTATLGDSGSAARYMASSSMATVNLQGSIASAGMGYKPTVDTVVVATLAGATPTVGKKMVGVIYVIPGA